MLNLEMTVQAVDFVISHMDLMHLLVLVILFKSFRVIVAGEASLSGNRAFEGSGHLRMAPLAFHVKTFDITMVKADHPLFNYFLGNRMA